MGQEESYINRSLSAVGFRTLNSKPGQWFFGKTIKISKKMAFFNFRKGKKEAMATK